MSRPIAVFLSSVLYLAAFPNGNQSWLAWIALVPLVVHLQKIRLSGQRPSFFTGWMAGTAAYAGILSWLIPTFQAAHKPMALGVLSIFLLSAYIGVYWGLWTMFLQKCPAKNPFIFSIAGAAAWTALEYLRTHLFSGFPWALLADTQINHLPLIQVSTWTGVYGVSFLVVLINLSISWFITHFLGQSPEKRYIRLWGLSPAVVLVCYFWGRQELKVAPSNPTNRPLKVALLQGNIDQYKKWNREYIAEIQARYSDLVEKASAAKPDLIVWPETSIPGYLFQDPPLREWILATVKKSRTHHLIGSPSEIGESVYNSSFSIDRETNLTGQYDKVHLVPFGELVPWSRVLGRIIGTLNELGGFTAGVRSPVLSAGSVAVGVNICYESIFPSLVRRSVLAGAHLIANQTNDGWYMRTAAPYQHWAPNIYRAVENRRFLLRANNTGISGIIDPWGRVVAASPIFKPEIVSGTVYANRELTFYTLHGDIFAILCSVFCIGLWALVILRR